MEYSHILWDFNGTILDDVGICMETINLLLSRRGLATLETRAEYQGHFRFPIEDYYRSVGFDFQKEPYDLLAHEWVAEYRRREGTAPLCAGARECLSYIKSRKIPQILFSATQRQMLTEQVEALGLTPYFDQILGNDNIYAAGKTALGQAWMAAEKPKKVLLVGDTEHDAKAAKAMGIDCALVCCGHQSETTLKATGFPVFSSLKDWKNHYFK